jgi:hypothetical protein
MQFPICTENIFKSYVKVLDYHDTFTPLYRQVNMYISQLALVAGSCLLTAIHGLGITHSFICRFPCH